MFLTRYWRDKVESLERRVVDLEAAQRVYQDHYSSLLSTLQNSQRAFSQLADQYNAGLERARKIQEEAEAAIQNPTFSKEPLFMGEEEEDLRWQLEHGALDPEEFNEALRRAGISTE